MFDPNCLQAIREYIYGPNPRPRMFGLRAHHTKWIFVELGTPEYLYGRIPRHLHDVDYTYLHIAGTHVINPLGDIVDTALNPSVTQASKISSFEDFAAVWGQAPDFVANVWGIPAQGFGKWKKLLNTLPALEQLAYLKRQASFERVRVCVYAPSLKCIESLEMVIPNPMLKNGC